MSWCRSDCVVAGTVVLNLKDLERSSMPIAWWPIYGAPDGIATGAAKNRMNRCVAVPRARIAVWMWLVLPLTCPSLCHD